MKSLLSVVAAGLSIAAFADGRDGLVHWWKVKDLNGDGLLQAGEVYDVMTVGAEKPLTGEYVYQSTDTQAGAKPVAVVDDVYMPTMRKSVNDGAIRFYSPTNYNENGTLKINYQSIKLSKEASIGSKEATVFVRIKWDGARFKYSGNYNYNVPIYANNYNDSSGAGWIVGLRCFDSSTSNRFHPYFCFGDQEIGFHYSNFATEAEKNNAKYFVIYKDKWYDVVYSFKTINEEDGTKKITAAALYRSNDTGSSARNHTYKILPQKKITTKWSMYENSVFAPHIGFHRGLGGAGGSDGFRDAGKDDAFPGVIHEVKVYNRYMSEGEMMQCLGTEEPICSIGSKNGSADEFRDDDAAEVFEPETMPWSRMRKTLNVQNPSVSIKCAIQPYERNLPRLVEIKFLKDAGVTGESIRLDMNGSKIGRLNIPADGTVRFFIPAAKFAKLAVDGETGKCPVIFTLIRNGKQDGSLLFDALNIGGAWQLGDIDKTNNEFSTTDDSYLNYTYHVGQNNLKKLRASIMGINANGASGYRDLDMYFAVGDYLSLNCDYKLTMKSVGANNAAIEFYLNDMSVPFDNVSIGGLMNSKTWTIPAGTLLEGENAIRLRNTDQNGTWVSFDYFRLEPIIPEGWRNSDEGITVKVR